jgi:hypothetical protein
MNFQALGDGDVPALRRSSLAIGELDEDVFPDIVLTGEDISGLPLTVLLINQGGTDFVPSASQLTDITYGAVALGDYNDDNVSDLILTGQPGSNPNSRRTEIFTGQGSGNFQKDDEATDPMVNVNSLSDAAWGDYDKDGKLDLLLAGRSSTGRILRLYQNVEGSPNRTPSAPGKPSVTATGIFANFEWDSSPDPDSGAYTYNLYLMKAEDSSVVVAPLAELTDGYRLVVGPGNAGHDNEMTILGLDFGNYICWVQAIGPDWEGSAFSDTVNFPFEPTALTDETGDLIPSGIPNGVYNGDVSLVDYYGNDDQLDLVLTGQTVGAQQTLLYRNVNGSFVRDNASNLPALQQSSLAWGDLNLDGKLDLLLMGKDLTGESQSLIFVNQGDSLRQNSSYALTPLSHGAAAWGDLDNDGDPDLVMTGADDFGEAQIRIYFNGENHELVEAPVATMSVFDGLENSSVLLVDYNRDDFMDVIVSGRTAAGPLTRAYANQGDSTFVPNKTVLPPAELGSLDAGDFDNDGAVDILIAGQNSVPLTEIWSYNQADTLFVKNSISGDLPQISRGEASFTDYQNDGWSDIFLTGRLESGEPTSRLFQNYENGGERRFQEAITTTGELTAMDNSDASWGDVNGDQKLDLVLVGDSSVNLDAKPVIGIFINVDTMQNVSPGLIDFNSMEARVNDTILTVFFDWQAPDAPAGLDPEVVEGYQYNLFLINESTGDTVVSSMANENNGYRKIADHGPMWEEHWQISYLEDGQYRWGVQAVDQDFEGGAFVTGPSFLYENPIPVIIWDDFPTLYVDGTAKSEARIGVNDRRIVSHVYVHHRGITETEWNRTEIVSDDSIFTFDITVDEVDELGLRYWFEVEGIAIYDDTSQTGHTWLRLPEGVNVGGMDFGRRVQDYNIVSVPLELDDPSIASVVEDDFGEYNQRQWRFWTLQNQENIEYKEGLDNLQLGTGYWLITKEERSFNSGAGETVQVTEESPFVWNLQQGWNQLGNPYNFRLWWPDILAANPDVADQINTVLISRDGLSFIEDQGGNILENHRGILVQVNSAIQLKVPVTKNKEINRLSKPMPTQPIGPIHGENWMVPISLESAGLNYRLGGVGMNPQANESRDVHDRMNPPRFAEYLDLYFEHPEYFYPWFSRDIVPSAEEFIWEFNVESSLNAEEIVLQWDNSAFGSGDKQLILFDVERQLAVDMSNQNQYRSWSNESRRPFRIYYGAYEFMRRELQPDRIHLGQAYPNPASGPVIIPFTLPNDQHTYPVSIELTDLMGRPVRRLLDEERPAGFQEIKWDGKDEQGRRVPAGVYLYRLEVLSSQKTERLGGRLIMR